MTHHTVLEKVAKVFDGYDVVAEKKRNRYPDVTVAGKTLNRGTARIDLRGPMFDARLLAAREAHQKYVFVTTHGEESPVLELGYPVAGPYVMCAAGTYMDIMLACAQKVLDENHAAFRRVTASLEKYGLTFRREINTDDYLALGQGVEGVHLPQDLARLLVEIVADAFPAEEPYKVFLANSGTEAVEAGIKIAQLSRWRSLQRKYGQETLAKILASLGIARNTVIDGIDRTSDEPVYADYPMFIFAFAGAFHGRTLGALSLTQSKKAHQIGFGKIRWVRHFPYNCDPKTIEAAVDARPLPEILKAEGVKAVLDAGRVPAELVAAIVLEPMQGEGGYVPGKKESVEGYARLARKWGALLVSDEVQTFARTGYPFAIQNFQVVPDVICLAKGAATGIMMARGELEANLHGGWHSNTWGGGKLSEVNYAYATLDTLLHYRDPIFDGRSYFENERIKGKYLVALLNEIQERHPDTLVSHSGLGLMHGVSVRHRDRVVNKALSRGLKLLPCGAPGEVSRIRLLFLADTLTKELEDFAGVLEAVLAEVEKEKG